MVTKQEINFPTFRQSFQFNSLNLSSQILVSALRLTKINDTAYKLDFFERMLNFLRIVALKALSNNTSENQQNNLTFKLSEIQKEDKTTQSYIEFLYHFSILKLKNNHLILDDSFKAFLEGDFLNNLVQNHASAENNALTKNGKKLVNDFLFVVDLIKKYNNPQYIFRHIHHNKNQWESLLSEKKLDYEVRLCETLYNLINLNIPEKIKSPFDEDYYTESGQNAFKNFTRFAFLDYLKNIKPEGKMQVLDLGCGYGNYIEAVHSAYPNAAITGIELNPKVCSATRKKFEEIEHIEIINQDFFEYAPRKKYDVILMNYVLFYFNAQEKRRLIEKAKSMLSKNGSIIICQYFSGIEKLKKEIAQKQHEYSLTKKIEMYYSDKILYANILWNDAVDTFSEAVKWNEFQTIINKLGLRIESMVNADKFYYSFFIELKKE